MQARKEMAICVDVCPESGHAITEQEWKLALLVAKFPNVMEKAMDDLFPSGLCDYLYVNLTLHLARTFQKIVFKKIVPQTS